MTQRLPGAVVDLTETALETFRESDRLLAVQAANHFDREAGTYYGAEVVHRFMEQLGLRFEPPRDIRKDRRERTLTAHDAKLMQAVDMAVGDEVGMQCEFIELVGMLDSPGGTMVGIHAITNRSRPEPRLTRLETTANYHRPYYVNQRFSNDRSWYNSSIAANAIRGIINVDIDGWNSLHEDWRATLGQIRTLGVARPRHLD
jgi:hypothetical protein